MVLNTNEQSPQGGAFSRDLLDQKSKSPLFHGPGGPWLQMTSALQIKDNTFEPSRGKTNNVVSKQA